MFSMYKYNCLEGEVLHLLSLKLPHMCKVFSCWENTAVKTDSQVALVTVGTGWDRMTGQRLNKASRGLASKFG